MGKRKGGKGEGELRIIDDGKKMVFWGYGSGSRLGRYGKVWVRLSDRNSRLGRLDY